MNGNTFVKEIEVECNGLSVYNNSRANESSNVLNLLKFSKGYGESIAKDQFFFLDTNKGATGGSLAEAAFNDGFRQRKLRTQAAANGTVPVVESSIPLNNYSYFAAFKDNLQPNLKTKIILRLEEDVNITQ